jgi:hypothetical protein
MRRHMEWIYSDGGRAAAGYKGDAGDCVTRAIAIATEIPYQEVYDGLNALAKSAPKYASQKRSRGSVARNGVPKPTILEYLDQRGWTWVPTMQIGSGCRVHLRADELPAGRIICRLSRHLCAVMDGVVYDTRDPTRDGTRCVYGYWHKS